MIYHQIIQCIINYIVILCVDNNFGGTRYRADSDHTLGVAALHWQAHSHLTLAFLQTFFCHLKEVKGYIVNWIYNTIFSVLLLCNLHSEKHIVTEHFYLTVTVTLFVFLAAKNLIFNFAVQKNPKRFTENWDPNLLWVAAKNPIFNFSVQQKNPKRFTENWDPNLLWVRWQSSNL